MRYRLLIKSLAAGAIVLFNTWFWSSVFATSSSGRHRYAAHTSLLPSWSIFVVLAIVPCCSLLFTIDAIRRTYSDHQGHAIGLAIGGFFTLGLSSLVYYLLWGRHPLRPAAEIYGSAFCDHCLQESTDASAPSTFSNAVTGTRLIGNVDPCPVCRSRIQTLWALVGVPLFPAGSYRVIYVAQGRYISRRTRVRWGQVIGAYVVGWIIFGPVLIWIIWTVWHPG